MIKFNEKLLEGKTIEELDQRFFTLNGRDEIQLTPFAEDKIAKAMKAFYGKKLKELSISSDDFTYVSKSSNVKTSIDKEETDKLKEEYLTKYKEINDEYIKMQQEYKDSHSNEFEWVEIVDPATSVDEEGSFKSEGGNLYELSCTSIKDAAIGYQTASAFLKDNPDTSSFPTIKKLQAKDKDLWIAEREKMQQKLLGLYPDVPNDVFNPKVMKEDYSYTIKWRETQKLTADDTMLQDAADEYIKTMLQE